MEIKLFLKKYLQVLLIPVSDLFVNSGTILSFEFDRLEIQIWFFLMCSCETVAL